MLKEKKKMIYTKSIKESPTRRLMLNVELNTIKSSLIMVKQKQSYMYYNDRRQIQ